MLAVRVLVVILAVCVSPTTAQKIGVVQSHVKISETFGNFGGGLPKGALFGNALAALDDLDGDGVADLAVGAPGEDAVYILFMTAGGTVADSRRLDGLDVPAITEGDAFGSALAFLGDLDGDGAPELAVGEPDTVDGGTLHVLTLDTDGSVLASRVVRSDDGLPATLDEGDQFGASVAVLGDLNGDEIPELVVGAPGDDDGLGTNSGAVWVLFLDEGGLVVVASKISDTQGNFAAQLGVADRFGTSVAGLGDLDGDGIPDLAVGAIQDDDPLTASDEDDLGISLEVDSGAVWILFLDETGAALDYQKISNRHGNFSNCTIDDVLDELHFLFDDDDFRDAVDDACTLDSGDHFGCSLAALGDIDGDGLPDLAVGARADDDGNGSNSGAIWVLQLASSGKVRKKHKISDSKGKFSGQLDPGDRFGYSVAVFLGEDGPTAGLGSLPLAVGAPGDDDGGAPKDAEEDRGALWLLRVADFAGIASFDGELSVGDKVDGAITAGGEHRFAFEAVQGSVVTFVARRRRNPVEPTLALDDGESELAGPSDTVVSPKVARIKKFAIESTGSYTIAVGNASEAGGDYRLASKAKQPKKIVASVVVPDGAPVDAASFEALAGWTLKVLVVKPSNKACDDADANGLVPQLVALRGPDDGALDLDGLLTTTKSGALVLKGVELPLTGTYTLELMGTDGTSGCAKVVGKLLVPKGQKLFVPEP
ncbi:MAG: FG-GAP repeat protein [Planctomycetes bacterium]|nr:FG-GAP repeat protein [Planctomycetota bacterium]